LISNINDFGSKYLSSIKLNIIQDESDNKFLELAETCNADYLITGNTKHFPMKEYKNTKIVSPKEFWELEVI
jgi:predicted nucleic acid-binding protein